MRPHDRIVRNNKEGNNGETHVGFVKMNLGLGVRKNDGHLEYGISTRDSK